VNRRNVLGVALAATIVVGACSAATVQSAAAPSQAPAPAPSVAPQSLASAGSDARTIHVLEQVINSSEVKVGSLTGCTNTTSCQGDYYLGDNPLVDPITHTQVGTLKYECFVSDTGTMLYHCPGSTITLTGRGQIVFTETVDFDHPAGERGPITGGTEEFVGATGVVTSPGLSDFVITITK
jgi:hypothetical protein